MEEKNIQLECYPPKFKNSLWLLLCLVFLVLGVLISGGAFKMGDYFMSGLGAFLALVFGVLIVVIARGIFSFRPYLTLTDEVLIIGALKKHAAVIEWDDILRFAVKRVNFNTFIEIILYDEEKYRARLSTTVKRLNKVGEVGSSALFTITWGLVKGKDRRKLVYELDRLNGRNSNLINELSLQEDKDNKKQLFTNRINKKYMFQAYGYSLIMMGVGFVLFGDQDMAALLIFSFIFYPFAKIIFDVLLGFKWKDSMEKQSFVLIYFYQLRFLVHVLLFVFSIVVAPFGILYVIVSAFYKRFKKR